MSDRQSIEHLCQRWVECETEIIAWHRFEQTIKKLHGNYKLTPLINLSQHRVGELLRSQDSIINSLFINWDFGIDRIDFHK